MKSECIFATYLTYLFYIGRKKYDFDQILWESGLLYNHGQKSTDQNR